MISVIGNDRLSKFDWTVLIVSIRIALMVSK